MLVASSFLLSMRFMRDFAKAARDRLGGLSNEPHPINGSTGKTSFACVGLVAGDCAMDRAAWRRCLFFSHHPARPATL